MGIREWMNENSAIVTVGAVVLLVVALTIVVMQGIGGGPATPDQAWFMDTETGEYFAADIEQIPPIQSPEGNPAVKVHFFSCGACNEEERFVGYYEKYTEEAKQAMQQARNAENEEQMPMMMEQMMMGQLYSPDGENWFPAMSGPGTQLQAQLSERCQGEDEQLRVCIP